MFLKKKKYLFFIVITCLFILLLFILYQQTNLFQQLKQELTLNSKHIPSTSIFETFQISILSPPLDFPDFEILDIQGNKITSKDFQDKIVFINFWASWCIPCKKELKDMEFLYQQINNPNFLMIAINFKQEQEKVASFLKDKSFSFPFFLDEDGKISELFKIEKLPTSILLNKKRKVIAFIEGIRKWENPLMIQAFKDLLELS